MLTHIELELGCTTSIDVPNCILSNFIQQSGTKPILADDVNIEKIANNEKCENYTGADLASLIREAGIAAFRELILDPGMRNEEKCSELDLKVYQRHFDVAFTKTKPSVSKKVSLLILGLVYLL